MAIKGSNRKGNSISGASMNQNTAQNKARSKNPIDAEYADIDDDF